MSEALVYDTEIPTGREGLFVPAPFADGEGILETVEVAERLGYNAVWATDFLAPMPTGPVPAGETPRWYEPLVTLAYAAARCPRIKLGTGVLMLPFRDPVILAKQAATLDQLSGGRLLLGLGLGAFRDEFEAVRPRLAKAHRGRLLDEHLEILCRLLVEEAPLHFQGEYVAVAGVAMNPKPAQRPLPVYLPGASDDAYPRAARWASGYMAPAAAMGDRLPALEGALARTGRSLAELDLVAEAELRLESDAERAVEAYRTSRMGQYRLRRFTLEAIVEGNWIGTPRAVADKIRRVRETWGIKHVNVLHIAADTLTERIEQMRRFAEEVVPLV